MMDTMRFLHTLLRTARDLLRPQMLWHALWPPLLSCAGWSVIAWFCWRPVAAWVATFLPEWSWLEWLMPWLAHIATFMLFAPLMYFTVILLVAMFALPRMMAVIALRDYPDVTRRGSTSAALWGSLANTVVAGVTFVLGWLLTLPLLLVPGAIFVLPLFWASWLNQRAFRFDALAEHAQADELAELIRRERGDLYLGGLIGALIAHVPFLNVLAVSYTAVLFVHLCLGALRELRSEKGITL